MGVIESGSNTCQVDDMDDIQFMRMNIKCLDMDDYLGSMTWITWMTLNHFVCRVSSFLGLVPKEKERCLKGVEDPEIRIKRGRRAVDNFLEPKWLPQDPLLLICIWTPCPSHQFSK